MYSADAMRTIAYKGGESLPAWLIPAVIGAVVAIMIVLGLRRRNDH
jgi:hypothetical protein